MPGGLFMPKNGLYRQHSVGDGATLFIAGNR